MTIITRHLTPDDFPAYYELYRLEHLEAYGGFNMPEDEVKAEWEMPLYNIETDLMGCFDGEALIGYAEVRYWRKPPVRPTVYAFVHPEYRNQGYGTRLTQWAIDRAIQFIDEVPAEARVVLLAVTQRPDGQQLLEDLGFQNMRESWLMHTDLTDAPPSPELPDGMQFITMADGATVEDIARLHMETFRDHRGFQQEPLEDAIARWEKIIDGITDFDPALFAIVKEGEVDVAIVIVHPASSDDPDKGFVQVVGVMPDYRRRGIGLQLLHFAFEALYQRGKKACELSVDASSLTGATRLYERAGMQKTHVFHVYELELRSGAELTNQG